MIEFTLDDGKGGGGIVDTNYVADTLRQQGEQVLEVSPDGMTLTLQDDHGPFQIPVQQALGKLGVQVANFSPANADYAGVNPGWRAVIGQIPTDDLRKVYLETQMRNQGAEGARIIGSGRDWFHFDEVTGQYKALTNSPDWDMSDAAEAGMAAPRMLASSLAAGATVLGSGGFGAAAAIPAGAAGGAAADVATRGIVAAIDPDFRELAEENLGTFAKDVGVNAAVDGITMGGFKAAGYGAKFLSPKLGQAITSAGDMAPISNTIKAAGTGVQQTGKALRTVAGAADNPVGRDLSTAFIPGAAEAQLAGFAAGLPAMGVRGMAKGAGLAGESTMAANAARGLGNAAHRVGSAIEPFAPGLGQGIRSAGMQVRTLPQRMGQWAEEVTSATPRMPTRAENVMGGLERGAERFAQGAPRGMGPAPQPGNVATPSQILENMARNMRTAWGQKFGRPGPATGATVDGLHAARGAGLPAEQAGQFADDPMLRFLAEESEAAAKWGERGRKAGAVLEGAEQLGQTAMRGAASVAGAGLKGAQAVGAGMQGVGYGMRAAGTLARPFESRGIANRLLDSYVDPLAEERLQASLRAKRKASMLGQDLAKN